MTNPVSAILEQTNRRNRILQHSIFWGSYYLVYVSYISYSYSYDFLLSLRDHSIYLIADLIVSYTIVYLTDKFLERKKYLKLIFYSGLVLLAGILIYRLIFAYVVSRNFYNLENLSFWDFRFLDYAYGLFLPVAAITILHLIRKWVSSQKKMYEMAKLKMNHELSFLKIQLNQHFLFNTLNNIDSLIYSDPETASQTVVNLSNLLRYSIYETDVQRVPVKKEIDYIITFIELYELRLADNDKIELKISGEYDDLFIVPRLFIPFVENALIYGKKDDDSKIYISVTFCGKKVSLNTMNQTKKIDFEKQGGVGIKNVKRTLDLVYPNRYKLEITDKDNWYTVKLTIDLDDERFDEMYNS